MRTLTSKSTSETPFRGPDRMSPLNSDIASPLSSNDFEAKTNEPAANDKARGHPEPEDPESPTANDEGVAEVDSESHLGRGAHNFIPKPSKVVHTACFNSLQTTDFCLPRVPVMRVSVLVRLDL